jgi:hypothetical protein
MPCSPTVYLMGLQYIFSVTYILARKRQLMKIIIIISGKNYYVFYTFLSKLELLIQYSDI